MTAGRPTECTPELIARAQHYVKGGYADEGDLIPSVVGMASYVGVSRSTINLWAKDNRSEQFSDIFEQCSEKQEQSLLNGGLGGDFNPAITKMILTKHGYSDKIEQAHTSPDNSMTPTVIERVIIDSTQD
tara:strand:- start:110 stop:499 length:390 start_codon:yes stop_codon:yes gene_type:complete